VDRSGRTVETFVVSYHEQRQGAELVNYANSLSGDKLTPRSETTISAANAALVETEVVDARGQRSIIWWHYEIGGRRFVVPLSAQLWYGLSSLARSQESSLIATRVACESTCEPARDALRSFLADSPAVRN
jgi:EpsI family protein